MYRLKFTSYVGAFGAIYIMICVVVSAPWEGGWLEFCGGAKDPTETIKYVHDFGVDVMH